MATLTNQHAALGGTTITLTAASGGGDAASMISNNQFLMFVNGSGSPITVTVASVQPSNQGGTENVTVTVAANSTCIAGPFSQERFTNGSGLISWTYSGVTSLTVASIYV